MRTDSWAEIESAADFCARRAHSRLLTFDSRVEAAIDGIVDDITEHGGLDPVGAGFRAIARATDKYLSAHGMGTSGRTFSEHYHRYWNAWVSYADRTFETGVDERLTLLSVWFSLPEQYAQTLWLYALHDGDNEAAAAAAGVNVSTWRSRLWYARRAARELWHAPEEPPGHFAPRGRRGPGFSPAQAASAHRSHARAARRSAA